MPLTLAVENLQIHCHRFPLWRKYAPEVKAAKGLKRCQAKVKGVNNPTWIAQYIQEKRGIDKNNIKKLIYIFTRNSKYQCLNACIIMLVHMRKPRPSPTAPCILWQTQLSHTHTHPFARTRTQQTVDCVLSAVKLQHVAFWHGGWRGKCTHVFQAGDDVQENLQHGAQLRADRQHTRHAHNSLSAHLNVGTPRNTPISSQALSPRTDIISLPIIIRSFSMMSTALAIGLFIFLSPPHPLHVRPLNHSTIHFNLHANLFPASPPPPLPYVIYSYKMFWSIVLF